MEEVCLYQKLQALLLWLVVLQVMTRVLIYVSQGRNLITITIPHTTHNHGPDEANTAIDSESNQAGATTVDDEKTFVDFSTDMTEEDQAVMCAQGHAAVYNRSRSLRRANWDTTEADLVGTGAWADE